MTETTQEGCILTGTSGTAFIARFEGHLTQRSMWNMNRAVARYDDAGAPVDVLVDVAQCTYMDSTMLGLLARWAITCADTHHAMPFLVGLGDGDLSRIFRRMSLDRLFRLSDREPPQVECTPAERDKVSAGAPDLAAGERARQVLQAHETLAELSPENAEAFGVLLKLLKKEVAEHAGEGGDGQ
jgi:anti-anti-sigma regulatory factor